MLKEEVIEVMFDGKPVEVVIGQISWRKAQKLLGESMEIVNNQSRIKMDVLREKLVIYSIKEIRGIDKKITPEKFIDMIDVAEGNKILKKALELNPLEEITAV